MNSKRNKKGGRPPKKEEDRRDYRVAIYMSKIEYQNLLNKAESSRVKVSECARLLIIQGNIVERFNSEQMDYIRKISGMANNLNQIAKEAHVYDFRFIAEECLAT